MISPGVAGLVLLAALLHASWNALVKIGDDRLVTLAIVNGTGALICAAVTFFVVPPAPASWPFLAASVVLHSGYYIFLIEAYRTGDLSKVYPLARGASPLLVAVGAFWFAQERLSSVAILGVLCTSAGITSLSLERGAPWREDLRTIGFALGTAVFISLYTVTDGIGVRRSGSALGYIAWLFLIDALPLIIVACIRRRRALVVTLRANAGRGVLGGAMSLVAYGLVIWAMSLGSSMAIVSALRETSVIFAALLGAWLLRERVRLARAVAVIMVAAGVVLINMGR